MGKASRKAVLVGEQVADNSVDERYQNAVQRAAVEPVCRFEKGWGDFFMAADMACNVLRTEGQYAAECSIGEWPELPSGVPIVRDISGNPFRPVTFDPAWRTATVLSLAQSGYDERELLSGHLDPARLAVLADALEAAGCTDTEVLAHLRSPGPHVRGCWAVDYVLAKG